MKILELKTVQTTPFRILVEALKEILTDANIIFTKDGLKIMDMDRSHTLLVHLKLDADKFEKYFCEKRIVVGLNIMNLFKIIKTIGNNDSLTIYMDSENSDKLTIEIENGDKNRMTTYKLNLMDLDEDGINVPETEFDSIITLPSNDFQKIIRDMSNLSEEIEIKSYNQKLIFSCKGDFADQTTIIGEKEDGLVCQSNDPKKIVQGMFKSKHLALFGKCSNLCNCIEMYMKNNYPLIVSYNVANLGKMKIALAPVINENESED